MNFFMYLKSKPLQAQLFDTGRYYSKISRLWKRDSTIIFLEKARDTCFIIGYGVVERAKFRGELSKEEEKYCIYHRYVECLEFRTLIKFNPPAIWSNHKFSAPSKKKTPVHGEKIPQRLLDDVLDYCEERSSTQS